MNRFISYHNQKLLSNSAPRRCKSGRQDEFFAETPLNTTQTTEVMPGHFSGCIPAVPFCVYHYEGLADGMANRAKCSDLPECRPISSERNDCCQLQNSEWRLDSLPHPLCFDLPFWGIAAVITSKTCSRVSSIKHPSSTDHHVCALKQITQQTNTKKHSTEPNTPPVNALLISN